MQNSKPKVAIVIPQWNTVDIISFCVDAALKQSVECRVIVVENGSTDGSAEFLRNKYGNRIELIDNAVNLGFAGGVNTGIRWAMKNGYDYVALLNSDAKATVNWLEELLKEAGHNVGMVTSKILRSDKQHIDTTGDQFTAWGISTPRGRDELDKGQYDSAGPVFAACGGATLYLLRMFNDIGLFDEDFFAYYEDTDISFRARNYGWDITYNPKAVVYHEVGTTSSKVSGFSIKMGIKNQPWVILKNVPLRYLFPVVFKFSFLWVGNIIHAFKNDAASSAVRGSVKSLVLMPKKFGQRVRIQHIRRKRGIKSKTLYDMWISDLPDSLQGYNTVRIAKKIMFWSK